MVDTTQESAVQALTEQPDEISKPRARSLGVLVTLLFLLTAFSFAWYFLFTAAPKQAPAADTTETTDVVDVDPFYMLLVGSDTRRSTALYTGDASEEGQVNEYADIITLARIDPRNRVITLVTVPRDTLAVNTDRKINSYMFPDDASEVAQQVSLLTGQKIPYFMTTTFVGYMQLVDEIGGVSVDVPRKVAFTNPVDGKKVTVNPGRQTLNGAEALVFARARKEYGGDQEALRQSNVRNLEQAMIKQVATKDESGVRSCLTALAQNSATNLDHTLLVSLALDYANHRDEYTVYSGTGPYTGVLLRSDLWAVPTDLDGWAQVMEVVNAGGDPNTVIPAPVFEDTEDASA